MSITEDHKQEVQVYELGYLVLPSVTEDNLPTVVSKIVSVIEKNGTRLDSEDPFLETLAYSMSKTIGARKYVVDEAYIGWMKFEAEPQHVEAIKKDVDAIEEVLRTLLIKAPRETTFTFAKAREAKEAAEMPEEAAKEEIAPEITGEIPVADVVVE
ncbi:MAG: Ribosomal protein [Parcubacteria group bacterium]|nr:Ribosomal protein [Parcubacteria group bacterium]